MDQPLSPNRFEKHIQRLDRRIVRLEALSSRFSWYRLAALAGGGALVWLAADQFGSGWGWRAFFAGLVVFIAIAALHRRLDSGIARMRIWRSIQLTHQARRDLDWKNIPAPIWSHSRGKLTKAATSEPADGLRSPLDVDLDLTGEYSLHHLLDCAASIEGSRLLANWLTLGWADPNEIAGRQALVAELKPMRMLRDRLALAFSQAANERLDGDKLLGWLGQDYPTERLRWALPAAAVWAAVNLVLFTLNALGRIPPLWTLSVTFYLAFYYFNIRIFQQMFEAIVELDGELGKFRPALRLLERWPLFDAEGKRKPALETLLAPIRAAGQRPSQQLHRIGWITAGIGLRMNPIMGILLNITLPWDYVFAALAARARNRLQSTLPLWFHAFYTLEAAGSLANLAALHPEYVFPQIDDSARPVFQVEGLCHPLIPAGHKVRNDFQAGGLGEIAVITGSNMAGKSTFIKSIGINLCLAYAGGPVDARRLRCLPFRLYTVIRISDSISDGYSYFYAEVRRLKGLLELLDQDNPPVLYPIDEIFRGTNNRERLIGSRSTLRALMTRNGVGLLATHDLELATLEKESPKVSNYHFRDDVQDGHLHFDYTIQTGPSPTTNALRIMAAEGLPVELVPDQLADPDR